VGHHGADVGDGVTDRLHVAEGLLAQALKLLVGHRVDQGGDTALLVIEAEVGGGEDRVLVALPLEQIGEDADEVTGLLGAGGDQDLSSRSCIR